MYGPTTVGYIFEGKHMKLGMEANIIIYLSLYKVYVDNVLERYPDLLQEMNNKPNQLSTNINSMDLDSAKVILKIFSTFYESLNQQALYLHNYMVMYEVLLLFAQASHDEDWEWHLSALDKMVPYFFLMTN